MNPTRCIFNPQRGAPAHFPDQACDRPAKFMVGRHDDFPICEKCIEHERLQDAPYGFLMMHRSERLPETEWAKATLEFRVGIERRLVGLVPEPTPRQSEKMRREHQERMAKLYDTACVRFGISRHALVKFGAALTPYGEIDHDLQHQDRNAKALQMAIEKTGVPSEVLQ